MSVVIANDGVVVRKGCVQKKTRTEVMRFTISSTGRAQRDTGSGGGGAGAASTNLAAKVVWLVGLGGDASGWIRRRP